MALADLYPQLQFIVQMNDLGPDGQVQQQLTSNRCSLPTPTSSMSGVSSPTFKPGVIRQQQSSRINIQQRTPGTPQSVCDAAVYILHLPSPSPKVPSQSLSAPILAELRAHIGILCLNSSATLVLTARLLPEPGTVDPDVEAIARLRDLSLLQLANERETEMLELMDMLSSVRDSMGRFVLVNKLRSRNNSTVAFEIRYRRHVDGTTPSKDMALRDSPSLELMFEGSNIVSTKSSVLK